MWPLYGQLEDKVGKGEMATACANRGRGYFGALQAG